MADTPKPPDGSLQLQIDDDVAQGHYVNMAMVSQAETEFTLDFIYVQPNHPRARVRSRVILNPKHAKRLLLILQEAVSKHEARHGTIVLPEDGRPMH
jgi:hypothetical protein